MLLAWRSFQVPNHVKNTSSDWILTRDCLPLKTSTHTQAFSALFFPKGRLFPGVRKGSINISNPNGNQGHGLMAQA